MVKVLGRVVRLESVDCGRVLKISVWEHPSSLVGRSVECVLMFVSSGRSLVDRQGYLHKLDISTWIRAY